MQQNYSINSFSNSDNWTILTNIENSIKHKIEQYGIPLSDWDISINYGIKTGYNDAFIIDEATKNMLISTDPKSAELIRPILRGKDIKRYNYNFAHLYLIYIPWHFPLTDYKSIKGVSSQAEYEFKNRYPAVYRYLLGYKDKLLNRNKAETGIRYEWYALQRWGANYSDDFFKPKIIFQEMVQEPSFFFDKNGSFMCLDTARIITGENLEYLLHLFNSKIFFYSIKKFYGGGSLGKKGIRMKHMFFTKFPALRINDIEFEKLRKDLCLAEDKDKFINRYFYLKYNLSDEEINTIESNI